MKYKVSSIASGAEVVYDVEAGALLLNEDVPCVSFWEDEGSCPTGLVAFYTHVLWVKRADDA